MYCDAISSMLRFLIRALYQETLPYPVRREVGLLLYLLMCCFHCQELRGMRFLSDGIGFDCYEI